MQANMHISAFLFVLAAVSVGVAAGCELNQVRQLLLHLLGFTAFHCYEGLPVLFAA